MIKRLIIFCLAVFCLTGVSLAQSGRRVKPVPTPIPVAEEKQEPAYSESAPSKPRSIYAAPTQRNNKSKSVPKTKTEAKNQPVIPASAEQTDSGDDDEVLKVETNLITIPVSVYDRNGLYIPNLEQ